jgi:putative tricarboxylic transport membrane protein
VLLTLLAPIVVELALKFGPAEYFALMVLRLRHRPRCWARRPRAAWRRCSSACCSGWSASTSRPASMRFAFGVPELLDGIDVVVLAVGLFAVGETLYVAAYS